MKAESCKEDHGFTMAEAMPKVGPTSLPETLTDGFRCGVKSTVE